MRLKKTGFWNENENPMNPLDPINQMDIHFIQFSLIQKEWKKHEVTDYLPKQHFVERNRAGAGLGPGSMLGPTA